MDEPRFRFHAYCDAQGIPLVGISGEDPSKAGFELQFDSTATKKQIDAANNACYKKPEVFGGWQPLPLADVSQFERAVIQDSTIPLLVKMSLPGLVSIIRSLSDFSQQSTLQSLWTQAKNEYGNNGWLSGNCSDGVPVTTRIEQYASTNGIALVAAQS
jgi:hypothetical protein